MEPLPAGSGFEFVDKVVGGAVPRQFIPSVEKGVIAQMQRGLRNGHPLVDLRVTLVDGKSHSVDSSDMAFQSAGALALREAAEAAGITVLEPYDEISVLVLDDHVGEVMGDVAARRGRPLGTDRVGDDRTLVRALVPQTEIIRYATDLRAATHGSGHVHPVVRALRADAGRAREADGRRRLRGQRRHRAGTCPPPRGAAASAAPRRGGTRPA